MPLYPDALDQFPSVYLRVLIRVSFVELVDH
ncbi:Uncharacterised protein [Chlamydia trachomatis]|nr:Uncharacterised protein [Chlamydia trachomatis]